jgi:hypothetical protein
MPTPSEHQPQHPAPGDGGPTGAQLASSAATFGLLARPVRLHLVWLITHGPYDVGTLANRAGIGIAAASQHLGKLALPS